MRVVAYDDVGAYAARVRPALMADEAVNNLPLGILLHLEGLAGRARRGERGAEPMMLAVLEGAAASGAPPAVRGVAVRTPPYNVVLACAEGEAVDALVAYLAEHRPDDVPGVTAPRPMADRFAASWARAGAPGAGPMHLHMEERVYQLERVEAVPAPPGRARAAGRGDRELLVRWMDEFAEDARVGRSDPSAIDPAIAEQRLWVWDDGRPVTMAGFRPTSEQSARIGPVYTPAAARRRGYATALVAAVSEAILASGKRRCFLFTDLSNPTSNAIYQRVGYRPVCDYAMYRRAGPSAP